LLPEWDGYGDYQVEIQIITESGEASSELLHALHYKKESLETVVASLTTRPLKSKIEDFERLLAKSDVHEKRDVHPFLETNEFLLHPNPNEIFSEVSIGLGTEYRIDFVIREADGTYVLVEIENPRHNLFNKSGDFTAAVSHAQRQVEDWQEWIEDNLSSMQKRFPDIVSPRGLVVIGRSINLSAEEKKRLARRNLNTRGRLSIYTYDQLLENARAFVDSLSSILN